MITCMCESVSTIFIAITHTFSGTIITSAKGGYGVGRVGLCLFICLSVSSITYKVVNVFAINFYQRCVSGKETMQ